MGAALNTAVLVSLTLKDIYGDAIEWKISTSTVELLDDVDVGSDEELVTKSRNNNAIHITISKSAVLTTETSRKRKTNEITTTEPKKPRPT
ncbi:hypothetical protein HK096_004501 [Nowakowskiella sp. JEL0078]|nr:hypothetical protein HK096_004501 [Nowakowskiella sp. JEL0078]